MNNVDMDATLAVSPPARKRGRALISWSGSPRRRANLYRFSCRRWNATVAPGALLAANVEATCPEVGFHRSLSTPQTESMSRCIDPYRFSWRDEWQA